MLDITSLAVPAAPRARLAGSAWQSPTRASAQAPRCAGSECQVCLAPDHSAFPMVTPRLSTIDEKNCRSSTILVQELFRSSPKHKTGLYFDKNPPSIEQPSDQKGHQNKTYAPGERGYIWIAERRRKELAEDYMSY